MSRMLSRIGEVLQGDWEIRDLNLLLVFQVNCPGCFMHAYPLALELRETYEPERLNILTMATAFEDFELNTPENARRLVEEGLIVGETARAFASMDQRTLPYETSLPLAVDAIGAPDELFGEEETEFIMTLVPNIDQLGEDEKSRLRERIREFISRQPIASYTFTVNQMRGTPSWLLFNKEHELLEHWFGHEHPEVVAGRLKRALSEN